MPNQIRHLPAPPLAQNRSETSSFSISYIVSTVLSSPLCPHKSSFALNRKIYSVAKRNLTVSSDVIYKSLTRDSLVPSPPAPKILIFPSDEMNEPLPLSHPRKCRKLKISRISNAWMPDEKLIKNFLHTLSSPLSPSPPHLFSSFSTHPSLSAKQSMMNNKGENLIN
jgi:hypothetical protein